MYGEDEDNNCNLFEQPAAGPPGTKDIWNTVKLSNRSPPTCFTFFVTEHGIPTLVSGNKKGHVQLLHTG